MKSIKRPLVVLIALIIVLSSVPMGALATEPGYDTVDSGPPTDSGIVSDDTGLPADEPPAGDYDLAEDSDVPEAYPPSADADDAAVGDMATPEVNPTLPEEDYAVLVPDETEYDLSALLEIMPLNIPPDTFDIRTGAENTVNWEPNFWVERTVSGTPALVQLRQGEIWTDKSVTYPEITPGVYEGTAVVTLYVWGRTYTAGGEERLLGGDQVVTISTGTGDFLMSGWTASRPGVTIVPATTPVGGTLTWTIPENAIIDPNEPLTITYELFLEGRDLEDWVTNFWYSTAGVRLEVKFQPGEENPIYWTKVEETSPAFEATVNWNNGGGLNSASITDNILNITISFAKNTGTPERQTAEAAPFSTHPQYWPQTATVSYPDGSRRVLHWHLEWMKETVNKVYTIVVHGLEVDVDGTPIGVRYVLDLGGGGGNSARAAGRYITSEYWFRRTADPDSGTPFEWDEQGRLVFSSELMAQVMLVDTDVPTGTLVVRKDIEGLYNQPWYFMDADWFFTARLRIGNDYVAFDPELSTASTLVFSGFVDMPLSTTVIRFTDVNDVITIQGLPTHASGAAASLGAPPLQYWLYEFFTFETLGLIKAYYAVDMSCSCPPEIKNCACFDPMLYNVPEQGDFATSTFSISDAVTRRLDLLNVYDHGIGFINVFKLLDGFPEDWEVVDDTEFYVRIWDEEAQNWLLFDPARINDVSSPFHDSFWCVGNHELGLTDIYPGLVPVMELPISVANRLRVSNLWTGIRYRVVEVRRVGNDNSPANIAATNLAWSQFWTGLDATDRLPVWGGSTWYDNNIRDWIENVWMAEYWEPVEEITPDNVGDSEWHADKAWNWGVIYPWHPENPDPYEVGGHLTDFIQFNLAANVTLTNRYKFHCGTIEFAKDLSEYAPAWDVPANSEFYARVWTNETPRRMLVFVPDGPDWRVIGFQDEGGNYQVLCPIGEPLPPARARTVIPFSQGSSSRLIEVPVHPFRDPAAPLVDIYLNYIVEEVFPTEPPQSLPTTPWLLPPLGAPPTGFTGRTYTVQRFDQAGELDGASMAMPAGGFPMTHDAVTRVTIENAFEPAFRVTYFGNGNSAGTPPVDGNNPYAPGEIATILPQGTLSRVNHRFNGWNTMANGSGVAFSAGYTHTMNADLVLFAQWVFIGFPPDTPPSKWFVNEHIWYVRGYDEGPRAETQGAQIDALQQHPNDFSMRPDANINRAEVAMVFYRLLRAEHKNFDPAPNPFYDVRGDEWYGRAVGILAYHGIFEGSGGMFRPYAPITRRELAAVVSRFESLVETDENPYTDVGPDDWAYRYILSATARGWLVGFPDGAFRPDANLTRAEFVTATNRVLERKLLPEHVPGEVIDFVDLDDTHWAYAAFMEASHSHTWELHDNGITERWLEITGHGLDAEYNQ